MYVYTVTIGRGGHTDVSSPLSDAQWSGFQAETYGALADVSTAQDVFEFHNGIGVWEGVSEESHKVTLLAERELPTDLKISLRADLARIGRRFEQDAIALTIGESMLIRS